MKKEQLFMLEALKLAHNNIKQIHGGPFGAVIVKDGKIIAKASNRVVINNDPTAHAEIVAIREACNKLGTFQLDECEIYTSCEPCPMCLGAIYWARPKRVYYAATREDAELAGFDDSFIYSEIQVPGKERTIPFQQIFRSEAKKIFKEWIDSENSIEY